MRLNTQVFSVETWDGISAGPIECPTTYTWSREQSEVSSLTLTAPRQEITTELVPWLHWVSCWDGQTLQWRGPIQSVSFDNTGMNITAKDVATFMWRTRTVTTKSWSSLDIATIASDMWRDMLDLHNIHAEPVVLPSRASAGRYSVSVTADTKMMNQDMAELAKLGLKWTVVKGRPVLGTQPTEIAAELGECHLTAGARIERSGVRTANNVRVQGKNYTHTERVSLGGLNLQSIVSIDDIFGVSNIVSAAREQALKRGVIKSTLIVPSSDTLTPDAPIELDTLIPGVRLAISALGMRTLCELQKVSVTGGSGGTSVAITIGSVDDSTELESTSGVSTT